MDTLKQVSTRSAPSSHHTYFQRILLCVYRLVKPHSQTEDSRRREMIFNITILSVIALVSCFGLFMAYYAYIQYDFVYVGIAPGLFILFLVLFSYLYSLSRHGHYVTGAYMFITLLFSAITYATYIWGPNLPAALLSYALVIIITSILLSTRAGFIMTMIITSTLIGIGTLAPTTDLATLHWNEIHFETNDAIEYSIILAIIMIMSWLSNREIEKSLARAHRSEAILRQERDNLEVTVAERTRDLRQAQSDKIAQLYRFAEFGRLASGVFHDLANPLTVLTNTIEQMQTTTPVSPDSPAARQWKNAEVAGRRMEQFMATVRKQLQHQTNDTTFSLNHEIEESISLCLHKARQQNVSIEFYADTEIVLYGNPLKFNQVITNLICNAVEAYEDRSVSTPTTPITITLDSLPATDKTETIITLTINDGGAGIDPTLLIHIFEPFFTTKADHKGIGLGLSTAKEMIEKVFGGQITVTSQLDHGTTFTLTLPLTDLHNPLQTSTIHPIQTNEATQSFIKSYQTKQHYNKLNNS